MTLTKKSKSRKVSFIDGKSYKKAVIDYTFGRHKDLSTLKSNIHFFGSINPHVYIIEVNNCKILTRQSQKCNILTSGKYFRIFLLT